MKEKNWYKYGKNKKKVFISPNTMEKVLIYPLFLLKINKEILRKMG